MSDLVRVRINGVEKSVGAAFAERFDLKILDEPTHKPDGTLRRTTRAHGRAAKPKTTVAIEAAAKQEKAPDPVASTPEEASK
jgi:hypothetical protein